MKASKRHTQIRRYRCMPMDIVLGLLADTEDEQYFTACRNRRRRQPR